MSIIKEYLLSEKQMNEVVAARTEAKVSKYEDIRTEFEAWIASKTYPTDNPLTIGGYTAQDIFDLAPFMDGLGVYNFMVTLREEPDKAKEYIESGFKRK
jgi:uncharacterized membrane protein